MSLKLILESAQEYADTLDYDSLRWMRDRRNTDGQHYNDICADDSTYSEVYYV
jgi:hypothetical protein